MHLITQAKNCASSLELERDIGVSYLTDWLMKHKVLEARAMARPRIVFRPRQNLKACRMSVEKEVLRVLDDVLGLGGRTARLTRDTHFSGSVPELDSMAVVIFSDHA